MPWHLLHPVPLVIPVSSPCDAGFYMRVAQVAVYGAGSRVIYA